MLKAYLELDLKSILSTTEVEGSLHLSSNFMALYLEQNILGITKELKAF